MKKVKEPAPHVKAAQIEKEAVRALSVDEVEEALTKSTYGGEKKLEPLDEDDNIIKDIEAENNGLRRDNNNLLIEYFGLKKENEKLRETIKKLREINEEWANSDEQKTINNLKDENRRLRDTSEQTNSNLRVRDQEVHELRAQVAELEKVLVKVRQENKDLTKTISKMKYAHDEEVRALEDDLAEAKILGKKKNEYADALDEDSIAFGKIRGVAAAIAGMADSIQSLAYMVQDETEGRE